jgi:UDP-N-acetyl-2-amino-2-deoxyglucuronate dehydrogenase
MDSYFPEADFFTEFERFDRHVSKGIRQGQSVDFVSVCSPNYLHDAHIRFGLRIGADVICEKPLVLNPWNLEGLQEEEAWSGKKVYTILQLRLHPSIIALKQQIASGDPTRVYDLDLTYITSRGKWYYASWKGDPSKSGGIATNIGVHFFDMLQWLFGPVQEMDMHVHTHDRAAGYLGFSRARVRWFLSIQEATLPPEVRARRGRTYRSLTMDGQEIEFSDGFTDLHTLSYADILAGRGFGLSDAAPAVALVHQIRHAPLTGLNERSHPLAALPLMEHPFGA